MKIFNLDEDSLLEEAESAALTAEMDSGSAAKTPVSLLQELYVKQGINPKYDLIQIEGAIHEPTFKYRVSVGEVVAMGSGQSKKKAKHAAAKAVLDKIWGARCATLLENLDGNMIPTITSPYDDGIPGNPVGNLQELCISHRWAPPSYLLNGENGLPHEREFVITCIVENYTEIGAGKSKKLAKRQAAYRMLMRVKDTPIESANQGVGLEDEDEIAQRASLRHGGLKDQAVKPSHGMKITQLHRCLRNDKTGEKLTSKKHLTALYEMSADDIENSDCEQMLKDIAKEQKIEEYLVPIEEKAHSGRHQCLLTLALAPYSVLYGSGASIEEAKRQVYVNALHYIKLMTRKSISDKNAADSQPPCDSP